MMVQIWVVKRVACYARAGTFTEAVASMVATPLTTQISFQAPFVKYKILQVPKESQILEMKNEKQLAWMSKHRYVQWYLCTVYVVKTILRFRKST